MRVLALSRHRRAKIWLDELPTATFSSTSTMKGISNPRNARQATVGRAAVEFRVPHGASVSYALLGGHIELLEDPALVTLVSLCSSDVRYIDAIGPKSDDVRVGLPEEYGEAVLRGVGRVATTFAGPTHVALNVDCAAHSPAGSSAAIFERVSEIFLQLLMLPLGPTDEQLVELFR